MTKTHIYISLAFIFIVVVSYFVFERITDTGKKILSSAKKHIGLKEVPQNKGFYNSVFANEMKNAGFRNGYEWCMLFVKMNVLAVLKGTKKEIASKILNASTQQSFTNVTTDPSGLFKVVKNPRPGDLVIWQSKENSFKGHAGIIQNVNKNNFTTIEGNTSNQVKELTRSYNGTSGMRIRGFIRINA